MNTNRERIVRAFDALTPQREFQAEPARHFRPRPVIALCAAILILGMAAAYASDLGGLREKITVWILGHAVETTIAPGEGGGYVLLDDAGEIVMTGSGVVMEPGGGQRPLNADEMLEFFEDSTAVVENEDGTIWFYYQDNKVDITRAFDEKGRARVDIPGRRTLRRFTVTREEDGSYSVGMTNRGYLTDSGE